MRRIWCWAIAICVVASIAWIDAICWIFGHDQAVLTHPVTKVRFRICKRCHWWEVVR